MKVSRDRIHVCEGEGGRRKGEAVVKVDEFNECSEGGYAECWCDRGS